MAHKPHRETTNIQFNTRLRENHVHQSKHKRNKMLGGGGGARMKDTTNHSMQAFPPNIKLNTSKPNHNNCSHLDRVALR